MFNYIGEEVQLYLFMDNLPTQLSERLRDRSPINIFVLLTSMMQSYNKEIFTRQLRKIGKSCLLVILVNFVKKSDVGTRGRTVIQQNQRCCLLFTNNSFYLKPHYIPYSWDEYYLSYFLFIHPRFESLRISEHFVLIYFFIKVHYCRFENLSISSSSYENNILKISH